MTVSSRSPIAIAPPADAQAEQPRSLGPSLDFMRLLWRVDHAIQSTSKRLELDSGVTGPQRLVLRIVAKFPGVSAGEVAGLLHLHPSTLTGVLQRLQSRGLLQRRVDPLDARRALFSTTARGRRIADSGSGALDSAVRKVTERMPQEAAAARLLLTELAAELERAQG